MKLLGRKNNSSNQTDITFALQFIVFKVFHTYINNSMKPPLDLEHCTTDWVLSIKKKRVRRLKILSRL